MSETKAQCPKCDRDNLYLSVAGSAGCRVTCRECGTETHCDYRKGVDDFAQFFRARTNTLSPVEAVEFIVKENNGSIAFAELEKLLSRDAIWAAFSQGIIEFSWDKQHIIISPAPEVVSTDKCNVVEIADASAGGRLHVDPETSQGFILRSQLCPMGWRARGSYKAGRTCPANSRSHQAKT